MIRKIGEWLPHVDEDAIIDETAIIMGNVRVGKAIVFPQVLIRAEKNEVIIEDDVAILDKAFIEGHKKVIIERGSIISHGAIIHGSKIGRNVLIGMGAIVMDVSIGENSIVASASLVKEDVMPYSMVAGLPAKKVREINKEDMEYIKRIREEIKEKAEWLK